MSLQSRHASQRCKKDEEETESNNEGLIDAGGLIVGGLIAGGLLAGGVWALAKAIQHFSQDEDNPVYLYHYTNEEGVMKIRSTKRIRKTESRARDSFFGEGVYLTSMHPRNGRIHISKNNYDDGRLVSKLEKVKMFFRFRTRDLRGVERQMTKSRDVWLYQQDILLDRVGYVFGETDNCDKLFHG